MMKTIRFKLIVGFLAVTLSLILMLFFNNQYAIHVVRSQVSESYGQMITLYMDEIDTELDNIDKYMNTIISYENDLYYMDLAASEQEYTKAKIILFNKLNNQMPVYKMVDSFFTYSATRDDFLEVYSETEAYSVQVEIQDYIRDLLERNESVSRFGEKNWNVHKINGAYYLFHIIKSGNMYLGAWVQPESLSTPLHSIDPEGKSTILFTASDGTPITDTGLERSGQEELFQSLHSFYSTGDMDEYLIVTDNSARGTFNIAALIPQQFILERLPYLQRLISVLLLASLIIIPAGLFLIKKAVLKPIKKLIIAMLKIKAGNLDARITPFSTSDEFKIMINTFNEMISEIQTLRIDVYEEQISRQREELLRLQLQLNPHFVLNSLNILYNYSKTGDCALLQEMTVSLIDYFKFIFRNNLRFVLLRDEIDHVKNYLRIQKLRYPENLTYSIYVPEFLLDTPVPPIFIQTFVENSIKYSGDFDTPVNISIDIDFTEIRGGQYIQVILKDTGRGFSEADLDMINSKDTQDDGTGAHTGIRNAQRRLAILYNNKARLNVYNDEGAVVEIILPIRPD